MFGNSSYKIMKTQKRPILTFLLLVGVFAIAGCRSSENSEPAKPLLTVQKQTVQPSISESWEAISNRFGVAPIGQVTEAAKSGDPSAQYYLGVEYSSGDKMPKDDAEGFKWMQSAALHGRAQAQRKLGWMFQNGSGTETNMAEAASWYGKAAQQGDAKAQLNLGWMYENGVGEDQDYSKAAQLYRQAADQGEPMAQNNLGWLHKQGLGVPKDPSLSVQWFEKSAEQGENTAKENLAWIYAQGVYGPKDVTNYGPGALVRSGGIAPDHELAEMWMRKAVDLDTAEGQYKLGDLIENEMTFNYDSKSEILVGDNSRSIAAAEWLRKAAEQGYSPAQYELGDLYLTGKLGDDQRSNCIPWLLSAAEQGNVKAQSAVGGLAELFPGNPLLKSVDNISILRRSAEQGDLKAQFQLAKRFQYGVGVQKDPGEAFKWMRLAANNSTASSLIGDAKYCLGDMYEKGEGTAQDVAQAHQLFLEAAGPGFRQSLAAFRVGQMYEKGDGVMQDDHAAMTYYCNDLQDPEHPVYPAGYAPGEGAVESLLRLWARGRGFPNDKDKAENNYDAGRLIPAWDGMIITAQAEFYAGQIYYQGKIVTQDMVEAAARFQIAADENESEASQALSGLASKLSPAQKEAMRNRVIVLKGSLEGARQNNSAIKIGIKMMPWAYPGH
jgi:TPR repeat protein